MCVCVCVNIIGCFMILDGSKPLFQQASLTHWHSWRSDTSRHGHASYMIPRSRKTSPQFRWFLRWRVSHKKQFITRKMWFCQPKIGLLYYIDEVCVSSLQSHIMATPFDIPMLAPDASMALSIGGGAGSWRANSSPKAPGKTYVTNQSKHQPPYVESKAPKVKNMQKKLRLGKFYSRPYSLIVSTGSSKKSNRQSVLVPSWGALRIAC